MKHQVMNEKELPKSENIKNGFIFKTRPFFFEVLQVLGQTLS